MAAELGDDLPLGHGEGDAMDSWLQPVLIFAGWFLLQWVVLPRLGVST